MVPSTALVSIAIACNPLQDTEAGCRSCNSEVGVRRGQAVLDHAGTTELKIRRPVASSYTVFVARPFRPLLLFT